MGYLALATSITIWLETATAFGLDMIGARWVATSPGNARYILGKVMTFRGALSILLSLGLFLFSGLFVNDPILRSLLWARIVLIFEVVFNTDFLFIGLGRSVPLAVRKVLWRLLYLVVLWLILSRATLLPLVTLYTSVPLANGSVAIVLDLIVILLVLQLGFPRWGGADTHPVPDLGLKQMVGQGFPVMVSDVVTIGYYNLGVLILGMMSQATLSPTSSIQNALAGGNITTNDVGYLAIAIRPLQLSLFVITALARTFGPRLAALASGRDWPLFDRTFSRYKAVCFTMGLAGALGIVILARPVTLLLFGSDFENTIGVLRVLSLYFLVFALLTPYSSAILFAGSGRDYLWANLFGLLGNGLFCLLLIPSLSYMGAAVATVCGALATWMYTMWAYHRWHARQYS
jgi:O-antigen/teichoic acid export membrane protein